MEFIQVKSVFTEEERKEALIEALISRNPILIQLASEVTDGKQCFEGWMYSREERKIALRKALKVKNPVLIELALEVADDITGLETSLIKHKIVCNDVAFVKKTLQIKQMYFYQLNECVVIALKNQNKDMLQIFFDFGASKSKIMKYAFEMGQIDSVKVLMEAGCDLNFEEAIKHIIDGCSSQYIEIINWLLKQMPDKSLNGKNFESMVRYAMTYGKDHIARHIQECLEVYKEKFISD